MRRATGTFPPLPLRKEISIHALHEESDTGSPYFAMVQSVFQSTLSMRRATFDVPRRISAYRISIHALHEESDRAYRIDLVHTVIISIHALHEESDAYH